MNCGGRGAPIAGCGCAFCKHNRPSRQVVEEKLRLYRPSGDFHYATAGAGRDLSYDLRPQEDQPTWKPS